ncbi:MAG: SpoIIIAC/SpoIIIAD family protein [Eubacteriales bacterium]|nr:SpoIIIAC/SpoIIIAD family protein [Eubacteriales bacterium]
MTVVKLLGVALLSCAAAVILRAYKPELVIPFVIAAGCVLLLSVLEALTGIFSDLRAALARYGIDARYMGVAIRVIGIAYLIQFASNICKDAGENALSGKVEMVGRVLILSVSIPVILDILDILARFAAYI